MRANANGIRQILRFAIVGCCGFVVDATVLTALVNGLGWSPYGARVLSFAAAVTCTWYCNRRWVFDRTLDRAKEYRAYTATQVGGAALNLGTYALIIAAFPALARYPVVPLAAGAALGMVFNYLTAKHLVFGRLAPGER
jgi:putative flippase GtrA